MKILLRNFGGKYYVWQNAEYKNGHYNIDGCCSYDETAIVAIKDAENTNYVVCNYCGEKIPDNPKSIERHFAEKEAQKNCMTCSHCRPSRTTDKQVSVTKNSNGTYSVTETSIAKLLECGVSWRDIDHPYTKQNCPYAQCRRCGTSVYGGILMKYPDLFETQITNDFIVKKKYEYSHDCDDRFLYDLKCRKTLFAVVNEHGIVECFMLDYQYRRTFFHYSAKYDKLFYTDNGKYQEGKPHWVSQTKYDQIANRIRGLYKGVKVDE